MRHHSPYQAKRPRLGTPLHGSVHAPRSFASSFPLTPMASSSPSHPPVLRHVAMLPFMAKGHAMPLLHLARALLRRGLAMAVTFLATPRDAPFICAAAPGGAAVVELPFPTSASGPQSMEDVPTASASAYLDVVSTAALLRPAFAAALAALDPRPDLLVHDGFLAWPKDAADELGVPRLVSLGIGAFATWVPMAVMVQKPHAGVSSPSEPFEVDGLPGLRLTTADLAAPFDDPAEPSGPHWDFILECGAAMGTSRGTILNSFHELESLYIDSWNREMPVKIWPVGPLNLAGEPDMSLEPDIAGWLDSRLAVNRPVLYVAFGSQADLSRAQVEEIAAGLDRSGLDFIWVVRSNWLDDQDDHHQFENRFGDRGKVVRGFINQLGVLGHKAIKGFFSHCGWNSVMESISMGVPILAYPLAAEQKMNAKFVVDVVGIGMRVWPSKTEDGGGHGSELVSSEDVSALARELILGEGGKRVAARVSELAASARAAVETGGSSSESLELMVREVCESGCAEAKE